MRRATLTCFAAALVLAALPAAADEPGMARDEIVVMTYVIQVRPDSVLQFEDAVKAHMAMHAEAGDPYGMTVYQEVLGDHMGTYVLRSFPRHWSDFDDEMEIPGDRKDVMSNIVPLTEHAASHMSAFMPEISNWPEDLHPRFVEVDAFRLDYGAVDDFFYAVRKIDAAIKEKSPDMHYAWDRILLGGGGPEFVLAFPHDSWADFARPDPPLEKILDEVYGETEAQMLWKMIGDGIEEEHDMVFVMRPDLSYMPSKD